MVKRTKYLAISLVSAIVGLFFITDSRLDITGSAVESSSFLGLGSSGLGVLFVFASIILFVIAWALKEE